MGHMQAHGDMNRFLLRSQTKSREIDWLSNRPVYAVQTHQPEIDWLLLLAKELVGYTRANAMIQHSLSPIVITITLSS